MIRVNLLREVRELNRDDKIELIRLLQADLDDDATEPPGVSTERQQVSLVPTVWVAPESAETFRKIMELDST